MKPHFLLLPSLALNLALGGTIAGLLLSGPRGGESSRPEPPVAPSSSRAPEISRSSPANHPSPSLAFAKNTGADARNDAPRPPAGSRSRGETPHPGPSLSSAPGPARSTATPAPSSRAGQSTSAPETAGAPAGFVSTAPGNSSSSFQAPASPASPAATASSAAEVSQSVGALTDNIDPAAPGNYLQSEGQRVAVESVDVQSDDPSALNLIVTPDETPASPGKSRNGFSYEEELFRMKWGISAFQQAQTFARETANNYQ